MIEHRLPISTRWTLYALGAVEGQRVRRPRDPVAAWLLRRHPQLLPTFAAPSILAMIRARSGIVDRMIEEEVERARRAGRRLHYWGFGGGFDARWYRLMRDMTDTVELHVEVEEPAVMRMKHELLSTSSFARTWQSIQQRQISQDAWTVSGDGGACHVLVTLEGVATRVGPRGLVRQLRRIRKDAPTARVIVDLPGFVTTTPGARPAAVGSVRSRWSSATGSGASAVKTLEFRRAGYALDEDSWFSARPELRAPSGMPICSGTEAFRVCMLQPVE